MQANLSNITVNGRPLALYLAKKKSDEIQKHVKSEIRSIKIYRKR